VFPGPRGQDLFGTSGLASRFRLDASGLVFAPGDPHVWPMDWISDVANTAGDSRSPHGMVGASRTERHGAAPAVVRSLAVAPDPQP
jgi:hypothetical protein